VTAAVIDAAHAGRDVARSSRRAAEATRWRSRKERLRSRRAVERAGSLCGPRLEDLVEVGDADELAGVLVEIVRLVRPGDEI
jgi:hypothetical protein